MRFALLLFSLASFGNLAEAQVGEGVSRELARQRASIISDTRYNLHLELRPKAARMPGHVEIGFVLSNAPASLALDETPPLVIGGGG